MAYRGRRGINAELSAAHLMQPRQAHADLWSVQLNCNAMDRETLKRTLEMAEAHVAQGERHISAQEQRIETSGRT